MNQSEDAMAGDFPAKCEPAKRAPGRRTAAVAEALIAAIRAGHHRPGDKLPSEARLAAEHGVSRTVIREAMSALRADGLVNPRQGAGVFVLEPPAEAQLPFRNIDQAKASSILELLELRVPVEIEAAGLAARRRSPAQEQAILDCHRAVQDLFQRGAATVEADFKLHVAIAAATNNPRFVEFLSVIGHAAIPRSAIREASTGDGEANYLQHISAEHARIVHAISANDDRAARAAMEEHLEGSRRRYRNLI